MSVNSIGGITPLWTDFATRGLTEGTQTEEQQEQPTMFGDIFQSLVDKVKETDAAKNEAEYLLSVGELDNPATLMVALSQAQSSVNLMVQLRNRGLEAYSQLINMSV